MSTIGSERRKIVRKGCNCNCNCNCNCKRRRTSESCCSNSSLRIPGIKEIKSGLYFADANLVCSGTFCKGHDSDIVYEWRLQRFSGNASIVGQPVKKGSNRVEVSGNGLFELTVDVIFFCRGLRGGSCKRTDKRTFEILKQKR